MKTSPMTLHHQSNDARPEITPNSRGLNIIAVLFLLGLDLTIGLIHVIAQ